MKIGQAIKKYRAEQGLTQLQLAMRINKSVRSVVRYEAGDGVPSIKTIGDIFNKPIQEILSEIMGG